MHFSGWETRILAAPGRCVHSAALWCFFQVLCRQVKASACLGRPSMKQTAESQALLCISLSLPCLFCPGLLCKAHWNYRPEKPEHEPLGYSSSWCGWWFYLCYRNFPLYRRAKWENSFQGIRLSVSKQLTKVLCFSRNSLPVANSSRIASRPSIGQEGFSTHFWRQEKRSGSGTICGHWGCEERGPDLLYTHTNKNNTEEAEATALAGMTPFLTDKRRVFHFC